MLELSLGLIVGKLVFDIPMRGSVPLLFGVASVYLAVALGIGLWISAMVETQQQAMFVTFFIINIYLVRHFVTIARAILMKGAGPAEIALPFLILAISAVVVLSIAVRQYRKRAV